MANKIYDVDTIVATARKNLTNVIIQLLLCATITALSILAIIFYGSNIAVFICGSAVTCASIRLLIKLSSKIKFADYRSINGEIVNVHKDIKIVSTISIGGLGLRTRKYDTYKKDEIRLGVFIKENETINGYYLNGVSEEHVKYYEASGEAIHIWGTHFPIRLGAEDERWLCPFCGEFNEINEKSCATCNRRILK